MIPDQPASPPHRFDDDDDTRRLLRNPPAQAALRWTAAALGGGTVISARPLRGGLSSAMHVVTVAGPDGRPRRAVLRRYVRAELNAEEPDIAEREQRALLFVDRLAVPTPEMIACDPTGEQAGVPSLLMSLLAGRVDWTPTDVEPWLQRLVDLLPPIHAAPLPPPGVIRPYAPYAQRRYDPPNWARWPGVWRRAVDIFRGPTLDGPDVFIHRDFHPGNVLWRRGFVTGVVDWQSASIGPASIDVANCRRNLLGAGIDIAEWFARRWEHATGAAYHPWADIITIIGDLDGLRDHPPRELFAIEATLAGAVAQLGGDTR